MQRYRLMSIILLMLAAACTPMNQFFSHIQLTLTPEALFIPTATDSPTLIPANVELPQPCYFNWATRERPELSQQIETALEESGLTGVTVIASDYGENCITYETNVVQSFGAMETDFYITLSVEKTDLAIINAQAFKLMTVFKDIWSDDNPTGASSKMELTFVAENGEVMLSSDYDFLMGLVQQHPEGQNLLNDCSILETGPKTARLTCPRD
jgi:hypothetical protein